MTASLFLDNLLAWCAQIGVLIAIGAIAALTLKHPRGRLIFWQGLLAIALLLPAIEPWVGPADESGASVAISAGTVTVLRPAAPPSGIRWQRQYLLAMMAAGTLLRAIWIAAAFVRLRRHRRAARALNMPPVPFESAHVRWYLSDTISGPVTFGWLRPAILLPTRVNEFPADLREAIACHELVHVRRRDWLFVLAEEAIRGMFWFHPAIWYALSQIQLAREQVVDLEVVRLTRDRERYLDALLAVAAHKFLPDVAPAPLFLKKRQLAVRVAAVLKETRMSKPRIVASLTTVASVALIAARLAVWFFPLQSPAQSIDTRSTIAPDGIGVTVDAGGKLMHRLPVFYPPGTKVSGIVQLEANLNTKGEVIDARVLSGPDELRRSALQNVLQWHYSATGGAPPMVRISIRYEAPTTNLNQPSLSAPARVNPEPATQLIVKQIEFAGIPAEVADRLKEAIQVHIGDTISSQTLAQINERARTIDEHIALGMSSSQANDGPREVKLRLSLGPQGPPPPPPPAKGISGGIGSGTASGIGGGVSGGVGTGAELVSNSPQRIRVGGNVQAANLISKVTPPYPPLAKQARIQGVVRFNVIIDKEGFVQNVELVTGHPLLAPVALEAVKQWVYKPTLLNGNPVDVITQVDVNFTLSEEQQ